MAIRLRTLIWRVVVAAFVTLLAGGGYFYYYKYPRYTPALPEAFAALKSDETVEVTDKPWYVLKPRAGTADTALIFYPGGRCDPEGYAKPLRAVAEAGYLVVLVPMPLTLAVLAPDRAGEVIAAFPEIRRWVIAGHSVGGTMAARYAMEHPGRLAGVLLWDAYPDAGHSLAEATLPVRLLAHTESADGALRGDYQAMLSRLPPDLQIVTLPGGTHMNFGSYVPMQRVRERGDTPPLATMPVAEQHARIVQATVEFLAQASAAGG